jgi:protein YIPF6
MSSYSHLDDNYDNTLIDDEVDDGQVENDFIVNDEDPYSNVPPQYIAEPPTSSVAGGERLEQRRFMGGDTLDEPVATTLMRDIKAVGTRLRRVVWIYSTETDQEWDLWGPLIFCLLISTTLSMIAPNHQSSIVFSGLFALIWIGQGLVTLNIKLLGGSISYFHALCVAGYSLFPLVFAALLSSFVGSKIIRLIVDVVMVAWAIFAATRGLQHSGVLPSRVFLASFPVALFYTGVGWICVIS